MLESAIKDEKTKQLGSMRNALLDRKINKEKKRKQTQQEAEEKQRRESVARMNAGMARAFTELIRKTQFDVDAARRNTIANGMD